MLSKAIEKMMGTNDAMLAKSMTSPPPLKNATLYSDIIHW
jgi:hypothetical protein